MLKTKNEIKQNEIKKINAKQDKTINYKLYRMKI